MEGANGVKTGYTRAAGRLLVSGACRNGRQLIAVTIDDPDDWTDHARLLEEGFSRYTQTKLVCQDQFLGRIPVEGGEAGEVTVYAGSDFSWPIASGERVSVRLPGGFVYAPVAENAAAGYAHIFIDDNPVGKVPIYYGKTVEQLPKEKKGIFQKS